MSSNSFRATANTGPRFEVYNRVADEMLRAGLSRASGRSFSEVVLEVSPKLHKQVFGDDPRDWRLVSMNKVFRYLFKNPKCIGCGGMLLGKCRFYCSKPCSMEHRTGYRNPSFNPEVLAKRVRTSLKNYGTPHPMMNSLVADQTSRTLRGRSAEEKKLHKDRIIQTNLVKYGVQWNTQNSDVLSKVHRSSFSIKSKSIDGNLYEYQGWEDKVIKKLVKKLGHDDVITQYAPNFPKDVLKEAGTRPDLFVPSRNSFVEVKSVYTVHRLIRSLCFQQTES